MAVYSMTGYATASAGPSEPSSSLGAAALHEPRDGASATAEIRSVNNRFLDLTLRLPDEWRGLEPTLREKVAARIRRGKVELRIASGSEGDGDGRALPAGDRLAQLASLERHVREFLPDARPFSVHEALHWAQGASRRTADASLALAAAERCIEGLVEARAREGARLQALLAGHVARLRELAAAARPLVPAAVEKQRERFVARWNEALSRAGGHGPVAEASRDERALAEATAYAIRVDVAEELDRLGAHLDEIDRLIATGGEIGKRLDFLIQELLREANTLGSKSSSAELTSISVEMKVTIEQLREQVQNVE